MKKKRRNKWNLEKQEHRQHNARTPLHSHASRKKKKKNKEPATLARDLI